MISVAANAVDDQQSQFAVRTWHLFVLMAGISIVLSWLNNEFVMTPDVYGDLLAQELDAGIVERQLEAASSFRAVGYLAIPAIVWTRVATTALIAQMFCLLGMIEIPFRRLFRAATIAFVAPLAESANRMVWIARQDTIDPSMLTVTPGSIAAVALPAPADPSWVYVLLSEVGFFQFAWVGLMVVGLLGTKRLGVGGAMLVTGGVWGLGTVSRVAFALYLQHLQA